ncbi:hypothetical protein Bbelb_096060 [Branchiostoma belcheri]|nr:hypothetical protein Bbelb_096060 [Branchiostoma belcheri]
MWQVVSVQYRLESPGGDNVPLERIYAVLLGVFECQTVNCAAVECTASRSLVEAWLLPACLCPRDCKTDSDPQKYSANGDQKALCRKVPSGSTRTRTFCKPAANHQLAADVGVPGECHEYHDECSGISPLCAASQCDISVPVPFTDKDRSLITPAGPFPSARVKSSAAP